MPKDLTRRELMQRSLAAGGLFAAGSLMPVASTLADQAAGPSTAAQSTTQGVHETGAHTPATLVGGKVVQPRRELPVLHQTSVLIVGGGPAGTAAAFTAKRMGVDVTLVERYGYLGGLATGGLVLGIFPLYDRSNKQVIFGIGEELMKKLDVMKYGIIDRNKAPTYPTIDAEAFKFLLADMVLDSGITAYLDCWGVDAIVDSKGAVQGAVFESKSGRQAILADIVIDCSGDGDIYAAAGAAFEKVKTNIGLISRIGNIDEVDMAPGRGSEDPSKPQTAKPTEGRPSKGRVNDFNGHAGNSTPAPHMNWLNMRGPVGDALDVADLTELELKHRRGTWSNVEKLRQKAGDEQAFLAETAPQLGVRLSRLLDGVKKLTSQEIHSGAKFKDVIGYSGAYANAPEFQIPYGSLVPAKIENVLAAGRCISAEFEVADITRLIPVCWVTGQAAGLAAALCIQDKCKPRNVNVAKLQNLLHEQGAYLG
ncbi:MAG TPA: FAD-dependent oxidoreductase [Candidatus Acidoferrum sp.]|nr:FAD-dependent oxidoreductase [Candidatus Acidoferrum sp.]